MTCYHPVTVWRSKHLTAKGKRKPVWSREKGEDNSEFKLPCGQCMGCRISYGSGWAIRMMHEAQDHFANSFLTMTYAPEYLPKHGVLVKRDVQNFIRRVRKAFPGVKIRYFAAGEYGEHGGRPHYHMILFGMDFHEDWRFHSRNKQGQSLYTSATLTRLWGKGHCEIGAVSFTSCAYVAGYVMKKVNGQRAEEHYRRVDQVTGEIYYLPVEFSLKSLHPGIGESHYRKYGKQMYLRDSVVVRGREMPVPRYYDRLLERDDPLQLEDVKTGRVQRAQRYKGEQTDERLAVREQVVKAKRKEFNQREL